MSDSVRPHRRQPTRLPRPWDSPGKNTGVGCHFLLQKSRGAELKITKPNSTISTNNSNHPLTEKSWESQRGTGFPENGALWDGGESNPSTHAYPQQGKRSLGFEASAYSSEISRPTPRSAPYLWAPGCWPAVGGCLRQSHTHHHSGTHSTPGTVSASSSIRQSLMK